MSWGEVDGGCRVKGMGRGDKVGQGRGESGRGKRGRRLTSERAWYARLPFRAGVDMPRTRLCFEKVERRVEMVGAGCGENSVGTWGGRRSDLDRCTKSISICRKVHELTFQNVPEKTITMVCVCASLVP